MALQRSEDKVLAGVCGGLAEEWGMNPTVVRVVYALLTLVTGIVLGVVVYAILYFVMDEPGAAGTEPA